MKTVYFPNGCSDSCRVSRQVYQIIGIHPSGLNAPLRPELLTRLPLFAGPQPGCYTMEFPGIYEMVSEYYGYQSANGEYWEQLIRKVYTYYIYDGLDGLMELEPDEIVTAVCATPFPWLVQHMDCMSGSCWREVI